MALSTSTMPTPPNPGVGAWAIATSLAENVSASANNPGGLALGDRGHGVLNSAGVTIFGSPEDGWEALFNQIEAVLSGASAYENAQMSIAQFAVTWTGNDNASSWANSVAAYFGVPTTMTVGDVINAVNVAAAAPSTVPGVDPDSLPSVNSAGVNLSGLSWTTIVLLAAALGLLLFMPSDN